MTIVRASPNENQRIPRFIAKCSRKQSARDIYARPTFVTTLFLSSSLALSIFLVILFASFQLLSISTLSVISVVRYRSGRQVIALPPGISWYNSERVMLLLSYTCANLTVYSVTLKETPVYKYTTVSFVRARVAISRIFASRWKIHAAKAKRRSTRKERERERGGKQRARLHFPLAVAPSFLRALSSHAGWHSCWLSTHNVRVRSVFFFSACVLSPRLICYSLTRQT